MCNVPTETITPVFILLMIADYKSNYLKPNPNKTLLCAFHLRNNVANCKLEVTWESEALVHCNTPIYLGVTLDRVLIYK